MSCTELEGGSRAAQGGQYHRPKRSLKDACVLNATNGMAAFRLCHEAKANEGGERALVGNARRSSLAPGRVETFPVQAHEPGRGRLQFCSGKLRNQTPILLARNGGHDRPRPHVCSPGEPRTRRHPARVLRLLA
ncbi:hypothetical protein PHYPSEUDO_007923 [Phytophthora pseudosyringae]|uniref:Uncharacterized protein n=1 Tax=Phytophthora pseudosyringae TaxID=221518 RepID=A0A8T1WDY6_9STRA|nr:hypothetical protein PHYPSEUDO_007923 [Phytophthora pseudosyringae]